MSAASKDHDWWAAALNRRATVEQWMFDAARGKRPMPTPEELRAWALKLGTPADGEPTMDLAPIGKIFGDGYWNLNRVTGNEPYRRFHGGVNVYTGEQVQVMLRNASAEAPARSWRCFHCEEVFTTVDSAIDHFGPSIHSDPACTIDAHRLRELEAELARYRQEDTDLHRQIHGMQAKHQTELQREEEKGYARGMAAMQPAMQKALEALELAHSGLRWYRDMHPGSVDGSDDEADAEINAATSALRELLPDQEKS